MMGMFPGDPGYSEDPRPQYGRTAASVRELRIQSLEQLLTRLKFVRRLHHGDTMAQVRTVDLVAIITYLESRLNREIVAAGNGNEAETFSDAIAVSRAGADPLDGPGTADHRRAPGDRRPGGKGPGADQDDAERRRPHADRALASHGPGPRSTRAPQALARPPEEMPGILLPEADFAGWVIGIGVALLVGMPFIIHFWPGPN